MLAWEERPDRVWGPHSLLLNEEDVSFLGVKRPEREVDHSPVSSTEVNKWCYPSGPPIRFNRLERDKLTNLLIIFRYVYSCWCSTILYCLTFIRSTPTPSNCRGHERVELYLYSPSGPQWPVIGWAFTLKLTRPNLKVTHYRHVCNV